MRGEGSEDVVLMLTGLLAAQLRVEFEFYRLTKTTQVFVSMWGVQDVLCSVRKNSLALNFQFFLFSLVLCFGFVCEVGLLSRLIR